MEHMIKKYMPIAAGALCLGFFLASGCKEHDDVCSVNKNSRYTYDTVLAKAASCQVCHNKNNPDGAGFDMTDYDSVVQFTTCEPDSSVLYQVISSGSMQQYSTDDLNVEVREWIKAGTPKGPAVCEADTSVYSFETLTSVASACSNCHYDGAPGALGAGFDFGDYESVKSRTICGDPENSHLYKMVTTGSMARYANEDVVAEIKSWILNGMGEKGGKLDRCDVDTSTYSFDTVLEAAPGSCNVCHSSENKDLFGAGFDLTDYSRVSELITCNPETSRLYLILRDGSMKNYTTDAFNEEVLNWIEAGGGE